MPSPVLAAWCCPGLPADIGDVAAAGTSRWRGGRAGGGHRYPLPGVKMLLLPSVLATNSLLPPADE